MFDLTDFRTKRIAELKRRGRWMVAASIPIFALWISLTLGTSDYGHHIPTWAQTAFLVLFLCVPVAMVVLGMGWTDSYPQNLRDRFCGCDIGLARGEEPNAPLDQRLQLVRTSLHAAGPTKEGHPYVVSVLHGGSQRASYQHVPDTRASVRPAPRWCAGGWGRHRRVDKARGFPLLLRERPKGALSRGRFPTWP